MDKSTQSSGQRKAGSDRPAKPYDGFPLFPHASGRWAKKIRQRLEYFGKWRGVEGDGWKAALEEYQKHADNLHAGRARRIEPDGLTMHDLSNHFMAAKEQLRDSRDISPRTYADYHAVCQRALKFFGKQRLVDDIRPEDFAKLRADIAKTRGPVALGNDIARVRILFKWGYDAGLLDKPIRYGQEFKKPSRANLRKARAAKGPRLFEAAEITRMLDKASVPLKAMILLAINAGFGNNDCATLPLSAIDFETGWLNHARPKTGIMRRCPLWPETVEALRAAVAVRRSPKEPANAKLLFITSRLKSWAKDKDDNPISKETTKVLKLLDLHRPGLGFYALRHTFQTIGEGTRDRSAVEAIMGHAPSSSDMSAVYREGVADDRLLTVTNHIRSWLYPKTTEKAPAPKSKPKATAKPKRKAAPRSKGKPEVEDAGPVLLRLFG